MTFRAEQVGRGRIGFPFAGNTQGQPVSVSTNGAVVESHTYDTWGNVLSGGASSIGNRYLFQGREYSFATGFYNFRARWYEPQSGRWLSKDPIGLEGGLNLNLYAFCGDDPVNCLDPWGQIKLVVYDGNDRGGKNRDMGRSFTAAANRYGDLSYDMANDKNLGRLRSFLESLRAVDVDVDSLVFMDHGYSRESRCETVSLGQEYNDDAIESLPNSEADMKQIGELLAPYATIEMWGCYVGTDQARLAAYTSQFGRTVRAFDGLNNVTSDGVFTPGGPAHTARRANDVVASLPLTLH